MQDEDILSQPSDEEETDGMGINEDETADLGEKVDEDDEAEDEI